MDSLNNIMENFIDSVPLEVPGVRVDNGKRPKRVFDEYMEPPYRDWRQYMSNYYLYLPFVGIVSIDAERYIGHKMSCDLIYDIKTSNLKYNILADEVVMESHEGAIRVNCPVTSASPYSASLTKISGVQEAIGGAVGLASGAPGALAGIGRGLMEITRPVQKKSTGGFTPGTAVFDSLHVYLLIETPEIYYGDGVLERYGLPDNRYATIGTLSGYVELTDTDLHVVATEKELDEIKALLLGGVVI